ncbi:GNAT family N-acetyltransferase [Arthrobacter sp. MYb211]|uniref:GNAT family N-acetyltransferase n=1 Tax=unclassified Arthrobacter TaxID=235627 RepID=UPI000CFB871D|nr:MULTISPECIES: GNAT family N-acetyltransferase [unclassified Arthrobacter]PRA12615.1 GNAT family N-acetyltransferase [Arthrobacter sp. MYb221]PRC09866.1 GNAT family N-acetyltransferase [Arthrobacter sp. MYb211]
MSRIREARLADCPRILDLIHELAVYEKEPDAVKNTVADLEEHLFGEDPKVFTHVAEDESGLLVGIAMWFPTYSTWEGRHGIHLEDLYVQESERGKGTGTALLRTLAQICVARGYRRLEWAVLDWNAPAIAFYDSIHSSTMDGWSTRRLDGPALEEMAR